MSAKLTPWFGRNIKPQYQGYYQTDSEPSPTGCYQFWTGRYWGLCCEQEDMLGDMISRIRSQYQSPKWRGLAEKS